MHEKGHFFNKTHITTCVTPAKLMPHDGCYETYFPLVTWELVYHYQLAKQGCKQLVVAQNNTSIFKPDAGRKPPRHSPNCLLWSPDEHDTTGEQHVWNWAGLCSEQEGHLSRWHNSRDKCCSTVLGWWVKEIICFLQPACKKKQQFKNGADEQLQSEHLNFTASEAAS